MSEDKFVKYYCNAVNHSYGSGNTKLVFYKLRRIDNLFTDASSEDLSKTHTLINEDFYSLLGTSNSEKGMLNSYNVIKDSHKQNVLDLYQNKLDTEPFTNYVLSTISIDKFNARLKPLLSTKNGGYIKHGYVLFNNPKLDRIFKKLSNKNIISGSSIKYIYTEDECRYMFNFLDFYSNHFNFFKYNSEFMEITREKGENEGNKFICHMINYDFSIFISKSDELDITDNNFTKEISFIPKVFIYNRDIGRVNKTNVNIPPYYREINTTYNNTYISSTYDFAHSPKEAVIDYLDGLFINSSTNHSLYSYNNYLSRKVFDFDNTSFTNINIHSVNRIKIKFINKFIFDKHHSNNIFKIKTENELVYLDIPTYRTRSSPDNNYLVNIKKLSIYIDNQKLKELIDNKHLINQIWINNFFNLKFNFYRLTKSIFYKEDSSFNEMPLEVVSNPIIYKMFTSLPSNKELSSPKIDEFFSCEGIVKLLDMMEIKPFEYQINNTKWMQLIERNIKTGKYPIKHIHNPKYKLFNNTEHTNLGFECIIDKDERDEVYKKKFNFIDNFDEIIAKSTVDYKISGGILSDEVGLGKTLSCLTHILVSLSKDYAPSFKENMPYNANNLIIVPNRLVSQWYTEIKKYLGSELSKKVKVMKITTITDIKKKLYKTDLSKYDIYIISNNLINNMNYIKYLTDDIYDITSYHKYVKALSKECRKPYHDLIKSTHKKYVDFHSLSNKEILDELNMFKIKDEFKFNIFTIKWNRIFLDEAHEVLNTHIHINQYTTSIEKFKSSLYNNSVICSDYSVKRDEISCKLTKNDRIKFSLLCKLLSNFKWCITATPFKNQLINLYSYINFLNKNLNRDFNPNPTDFHKLDSRSKLAYIMNFSENEMAERGSGTLIGRTKFSKFEDTLFGMKERDLENFYKFHIRINTKKDIKGVVDIPIFTEEITFLTQNNIERNIYVDAIRGHNTMRLFQLCTHLLVSEGIIDAKEFGEKILSLDEIQGLMVKKYKKDIEASKKKQGLYLEKVKSNENILKHYKKICDDISVKYDFNNADDPYFIEPHKKDEVKQFINMNSYSQQYGRYYSNRYNKIEMIVNIDSIISHKENIIRYYGDITELELDIKNIMEFPDELKDFKYQMYLIYTIYSKDITSNLAKLKTNNENIDIETREIERLNKQIKLFENKTFIVESVKDPCSICFTEYEGDIAITSCRHITCGDCMKLLFGSHSTAKCPFCRNQINRKDVNFTHYDKIKSPECSPVPVEKEDVKSEKTVQKEQNILKYGTKLAHMLEYLGEIFKVPDNRVIIFSQYDIMLKLIGKVLDDFKIKNLFIKGNITSVSKKIDKFKTDPSYRVIMLSSERCSSGSNLTEASHIIFADVINGDAVATKDMESQAIGRAVRIGQKKPVVVKRFIMSNTIEEEYYNKNKYDMMDLQL